MVYNRQDNSSSHSSSSEEEVNNYPWTDEEYYCDQDDCCTIDNNCFTRNVPTWMVDWYFWLLFKYTDLEMWWRVNRHNWLLKIKEDKELHLKLLVLFALVTWSAICIVSITLK